VPPLRHPPFRTAQLVIRAASPLVPHDLRGDWRQEWDAELAALAQHSPAASRTAIRHALGSFVDAFWLRQRHVADFRWIDDIRHGWRQLREHGAFAATAIGILTLGLAATVTMFSVTDQVLLRPLPYPSPDRIITLWETHETQREPLEVSPGNFLDWRARAASFEFIAGIEPWSMDYRGGARPEVFLAGKVTSGFFESFGVRPLAGRFFAPDEYQKGRDQVIVLQESFWRQRFGGDARIVGQALRFDDNMFTVVGIVPDTFEPRVLPAAAPRSIFLPKVIEEYEARIRGSGYWAAVAKIRADVSREAAQAEMTAIAQQMAAQYPRTNAKSGVYVMPLREHLVGNVQFAVTLLAGAVLLVLLIACVNVTNLLLARGSARERELTIRVALGARRARIVHQLLTETLLIAALGAVAGVILAAWVLRALATFGPANVPWIDALHLDWRAVLFAVMMTLVVAIVSGILPAWRAARGGLATAGRQTATSDRAQHRLRFALVAAEVALALVLVSGAGLLVRSFASLMRVDPGFERDRVAVLQVFAWDHNPKPADLRTFFGRALAALTSLPDVQQAGAVSAMPFIESNINIQNVFVIDGQPAPEQGESPRAYQSVATPGYFEVMRIPLLAGRHIEPRDGADAKRVTVISDSLARRYWPSIDAALGHTLRMRFSGVAAQVEIVGVVGSLRHDTLDHASREELFLPFAQFPFGSMTFVARTGGEPSALLTPAKAAIWSVDPGQTIYRAATLDELVLRTVSPRRFALGVLLAFASLALLLAVGGVYGVLSAIMAVRLREVGVRVALGASRWDILRLVLGRGLMMTGVGLAIGIACSLGAAQLLRRFLFEITATDPVALATAAGIMTFAAASACYLPARRAARTDPLQILRME
jgi:putative ABC transport system permease protein